VSDRTVVPWHPSIPDRLRDGDAGEFGLTITQFELADGSSVMPASPGVTAIVGGNNVGKSTLLRNIVNLLHGKDMRHGVQLVSSLRTHKKGSVKDATAWLQSYTMYNDDTLAYGAAGVGSISAQEAATLWATPEVLGVFSHLTVYFADALSRASLTQPVAQRTSLNAPPAHPLHYIAQDPESFEIIKQYCQQIFQKTLTLDRLTTELLLRLGTVDLPTPRIDNIPREYQEAVRALKPLHEQGDGMRSLMGLLLAVAVGGRRVFLVDEPEAFLHPPQAYALGRALAELAHDRQIQIILATHDRNLLVGLLGASCPVSIVRLTRVDDVTSARQLDPVSLRDAWADPVLRYSNVLDGLFHDTVIIAEGYQDCTFYSAAIDATSTVEEPAVPPDEIMLVPAGGSGGMLKVAYALRAVGVPIAVCADLDVLQQKDWLTEVVVALGGEWAAVERDYKVATAPFVTGQAAWSDLKRYGVSAFPPADAAAAAGRCIDLFDSIGLVLVRVGELERFATTLSVAKGPGWLSAALEGGIHTLTEAQLHARRLVSAARAVRRRAADQRTVEKA
jgi:ABC-type cobalamin/Fe3+-siderophores transport system ATPase subunit